MYVWSLRQGPGSAASSPLRHHLPQFRSCPRRSRPGDPSCGPGFLLSTQPCRWDHQATSVPGWLRLPAMTWNTRSGILKPDVPTAIIHILFVAVINIGKQVSFTRDFTSMYKSSQLIVIRYGQKYQATYILHTQELLSFTNLCRKASCTQFLCWCYCQRSFRVSYWVNRALATFKPLCSSLHQGLKLIEFKHGTMIGRHLCNKWAL